MDSTLSLQPSLSLRKNLLVLDLNRFKKTLDGLLNRLKLHNLDQTLYRLLDHLHVAAPPPRRNRAALVAVPTLCMDC